MKTDDLDSLGPGPDLDAIVAREVFGLDALEGRSAIPAYSTDANDCKKVIQACRSAGWWDYGSAEPGGFERVFTDTLGQKPNVEATGPHEYAVGCVAAVRVARSVGGPLVKAEA